MLELGSCWGTFWFLLNFYLRAFFDLRSCLILWLSPICVQSLPVDSFFRSPGTGYYIRDVLLSAFVEDEGFRLVPHFVLGMIEVLKRLNLSEQKREVFWDGAIGGMWCLKCGWVLEGRGCAVGAVLGVSDWILLFFRYFSWVIFFSLIKVQVGFFLNKLSRRDDPAPVILRHLVVIN
jgi:hypothetical protein